MRKRDIVVILLVLLVLTSVLIIGTSVTNTPSTRTVLVFPQRGTIWGGPFLDIGVSPPGYPQVGDSWVITVYLVNLSSSTGKLVYILVNNATVVVTVNADGQRIIHELKTDAQGQTTFEYAQGYSDIAFQAFNAELSPSIVFVLSERYVSSDIINQLLASNFLFDIASMGSSIVFKLKKSGRAGRWKIAPTIFQGISIFCFSVVTLFSLSSKLFQGSAWGYPENVWNDLITVSGLKLTFLAGVASLALSWIFKVILYGIQKGYKRAME